MKSTQSVLGTIFATFSFLIMTAYCFKYQDFDPKWIGVYLGLVLLFMLTTLKDTLFLKIMQILGLYFISVLCFMFSYDKSFGIIIITFAFIMGMAYRLYARDIVLRLIVTSAIVVGTMTTTMGYTWTVVVWILFACVAMSISWVLFNELQRQHKEEAKDKKFVLDATNVIEQLTKIVKEWEKNNERRSH